MHVEISVALNFVISYLYNKLPRRRVDLFVEEFESGLKKKFEGHWYPDKPNKGSGFRCIKVTGEEMDPVVVQAASSSGTDIEEIKSCLPEELTLWIDPSEVSYKLCERGPVKILYSDCKEEENILDKADKEVQQASSYTFNPEAQSFNPEAQSFTPCGNGTDPLGFSLTSSDFHGFYALDPSQSFQPIDSLSSSLSNLSLSPSSPVPTPGAWSTATSPAATLFNSATSPTTTPGINSCGYLNPRINTGVNSNNNNNNNSNNNSTATPQFTAASFAQTKFGSTKLKTNAKRPNRLSPTEFGNFIRQQQRTSTTSYAGPPRPRSLSPRDPRVEFLLDQQQRYIQQQQQQQQQRQMSPSMPYQSQYSSLHHQQHLNHNVMIPDFSRQHSAGISSCHSSPHLSPHLSPQGPGTTFQDLIPRSNSIHAANPTTHGIGINNPNGLTSPTTNVNNGPGVIGLGLRRPNSLSQLGRAVGSGFPTNHQQHQLFNNRQQQGYPNGIPPFGFSNGMSSASAASSPISNHGSMSQIKTLSPDAPKSFVDGLNPNHVSYNSSSLQHLLMAS